MSVGGAGRGRGKGRAGGAKGPSGKASAGKAGTATFGGAVEPLTSQALAIAQQLKNGDFKNKDEATRKLVAEVLEEKLRMKSSALTSKIADALQDDPRLNQALERLWSKAE